MTADPYIDPISGLLRNLLGIADADGLARVEVEISTLRDLELIGAPVAGTFDLDHHAAGTPSALRGRLPVGW